MTLLDGDIVRRNLSSELGFSRAEVHSLIEQGVESAWLPDPRKADLLGRVRSGIAAIDECPA